MLTRAPAAGEAVDFAAPEVTRLRRGLRNRLSSEEMPPHHHNNRDSSRHNRAALCAGLAPQSSAGFSARCSFQGLASAGGFGGIGGLGGSGFGLFEILLIAGIGYFLYRKFRSPAAATGYGTTQYQNTSYQPQYELSAQHGYHARKGAAPRSTVHTMMLITDR